TLKAFLYRDLLMSLGFLDVGKDSLRYALTQMGSGHSVIIIVGGASEIIDSAQPDTYNLTLKRRKGFVRLALETGYDSLYGTGLLKAFLYRDLLMSLGFLEVGKDSLRYALTQMGPGHSVIIIVGGASETLHVGQPDTYNLTLKNRKGFVRLALETGYDSLYGTGSPTSAALNSCEAKSAHLVMGFLW
ncbi:hypothetical protein QZH41_020087, partial [Actinostola sp. cb2023]